MHLIRSGALEGYESLVRTLGGNPALLFRQAGISAALMRNPNAFLSYTKMAELLELSATACKAPYFGLLLAENNRYWILGDLLVSIAQYPTLGEALAALDRHLYLHASGVKISALTVGDKIHVEVGFLFNTPLGLTQLTQKAVAQAATVIARLLNVDKHSFKLHLRQAVSPLDTQYRSGFFSQVTFGSSFNGIVLSSKDYARRPNLDEETIREHFAEHLLHLQALYPNNLQDQAKEIIGQLLPTGDCSLEKIAGALGLHPRILQKRLQAEGASYRDLLQQSRRVIAEQYLSYEGVSITDLALSLGYSDVSEFSRHFKAWTGYSPTKWRSRRKLSS